MEALLLLEHVHCQDKAVATVISTTHSLVIQDVVHILQDGIQLEVNSVMVSDKTRTSWKNNNKKQKPQARAEIGKASPSQHYQLQY